MENRSHSTRPWDWEALEAEAAGSGVLEELAQLKKLLPPQDIGFLFEQLGRLDEPAEIRLLSGYRQMQEEWGGGFYGMLPDELGQEEIPLPSRFPGCVRTALLLAQVRARNLAAIRRVNPDYPLEFTRRSFPSLAPMRYPPRWGLELDFSAIREVLHLFEGEKVSMEEAAAVARLPAFREMIRHRRELGYLPEPLVSEEGLAHLLQQAASRAPLDMIWKWISPHNLFDLADLFLHRREYQGLLEALQARAEAIIGHILGAIAQYATEEMRRVSFQDRVSFTVGWGIAGWATAATGGINLEHFKDDYRRLLTTLTHETFHRWQLHVCPADPAAPGAARSFDALTHFPFANERHRKLYEVLSYIFLEGTATFVAPSHPPADREESARRGAELLGECAAAIYLLGDLEKADELLNEGLKSNGPFYWFGAHMAQEITARYGDAELGRTLCEGSPAFFLRYFSAATDARLHPGPDVQARVRNLASLMEKWETPGRDVGKRREK